MTTYLFSAWLSHFIESVQRQYGGISQERRHLLILDGHNLHVTLDVIREARAAGLDILMLPAHTSHAMQPLDVSIFKPFRVHFRAYQDYWTSRNMSQPANKTTLAQWVSLGLRKALTSSNIVSGFRGTGIWPINPAAMNSKLTSSEIFCQTSIAEVGEEMEGGRGPTEQPESGSERTGDFDVPLEAGSSRSMEAEFDKVPDSTAAHFFVAPDHTDEEVANELARLELNEGEPESITRFLTLPTIAARANS